MNNKLLKQIILSGKPLHEVAKKMDCSIDDFVDKLLDDKKFNNIEIGILVEFIPIENPVEIFFNN